MRWLVPLISIAVGGLIAGWQGALIGLFIGCIVGAILKATKRSDMTAKSAEASATSQRSQTLNPPPPPSHAATTVERLHKHMRQIEASRSGGGNQNKFITPGISLSFGGEESPTVRRARGAGKLTWYAHGQSVIHAGLLIDDGMVYTSNRALTWPGEPSAIITSLPVASIAAHPLEEFGYYPSYDQISAEQRRCYLEWMSAGRQDANPAERSLGYVFIFFYGLERRIVLDRDRDPYLLEEVLRLFQHYGAAHKSRSLRSYSLQLLHFAGWQLGSEAYRALWPRLLQCNEDRPDEDGLRFVLANLHQRGETLDPRMAYRLALANQESRRSTVIMRAREKFFALFEQRFHEQFGGGFLMEAANEETFVQYRPASSALAHMSYERRQESPFQLRIPNITGLHRQFKALPAIWNSCVDDLSGYSRALMSKKQGQSAALAAWQSLPHELRKIEDHPLKSTFDELLAIAPREGDYTFLPAAMLAGLAEFPERAKLTIAQSRQITELASDLGWQLAPSPQVTALPLAWNQELALYRSIPGEQPAEHLSGSIRLLYLAVTLAAADGAIETEELDSFKQLIASQIANENDWRPLRATEASLRRDSNVALRSLPQMSKLIPAESRQLVLRTMAHIAAADSEVTLDELKVLRRMARAFELDADSVEKLLREDEAFREVTVAIPRRGRRSGETIPARPIDRPIAFALNQDRIKVLTQETREVISLLSVAMAEPEETPCPPRSVPFSAPIDPTPIKWLSGLETRYHAAVLALVGRDEITTNDFDCLAANHHLMPDDLFNAVNIWADDILGDFLLERGENVRIFRSLLPDLTVPLAG